MIASSGLPQLPLVWPWSPSSQSGGWIIRDSSTSFHPADVMSLGKLRKLYDIEIK